jgi:hypothetical protein
VTFREVLADEVAAVLGDGGEDPVLRACAAALRRHPRPSYAIGGTPADVLRETLEVKYGERTAGGHVYGVFDELERWLPSPVPTLEVQLTLAGAADAQALEDLFDRAGYAAQDWTSSIRRICRQCSEGRPPDDHEHPAPSPDARRRFGLAAPLDQATRLLGEWAATQPGDRRYGAPAAVG